MATITVLGATGFAGANIVTEAAARGHELTLVSRSAADAPEGARVIVGSVLDAAVLAEALTGADVVIGALSPRGDMAGKVVEVYADIAARLAGTTTRFIVIGGFGSMLTPTGERVVETEGFPAEFKDEARELFASLEAISAVENVEWTYVSPAAAFGGFIEDQTRRGEYRTGGDQPLAADGSGISGPDFALAVVDMIESGEHRQTHVHFAY